MTHTIVTRFVVVLTVGLLVAAAGFAGWTNREPGSPEAGAAAAPASSRGGDPTTPAPAPGDPALFDARCGACHDTDSLVAYLRATGDVDERGRELSALLARHGSATSGENARIVAHLLALARR
jgi:cytochrome c5